MCGKGREALVATAGKSKSQMEKQKNFYLQKNYQPQCYHTLGKHEGSSSVQKNWLISGDRRELNLWQTKNKVRSVCGIEITLLLP